MIIKSRENLFEMSNIVGKYVKLDNVNFSFHFSSKDEVHDRHGIRVKICWNREHLTNDKSVMYLHGNYNYVPCKNSPADNNDINEAREFFKKYKVLFAAVWEKVMNADPLEDYLKGYLSFEDLLKEIEVEFPKNSSITNLEELEEVVRKNNLFNMND